MSKVDELRRLFRKDEYEQEEAEKAMLQEAANEYHAAVAKSFAAKNAPIEYMNLRRNFIKDVICECMCDLYESALCIDDVEKYSKVLRQAMKEQCMSIMENVNTDKDFDVLFEDASPVIKSMVKLAKDTFDKKDKNDPTIEEYKTSQLLPKDDLSAIKSFEKSEGFKTIANDIQDRVIDVCKAEELHAQEQKEKIQAVVDELSKLKSTGADSENANTMGESIEFGAKLFNTTPKTIFNAIFVNKSKSFLNENASGDLNQNSDRILAETIATYTLLETIHSLGFKTYSDAEKEKIRLEFFIS